MADPNSDFKKVLFFLIMYFDWRKNTTNLWAVMLSISSAFQSVMSYILVVFYIQLKRNGYMDSVLLWFMVRTWTVSEKNCFLYVNCFMVLFHVLFLVTQMYSSILSEIIRKARIFYVLDIDLSSACQSSLCLFFSPLVSIDMYVTWLNHHHHYLSLISTFLKHNRC